MFYFLKKLIWLNTDNFLADILRFDAKIAAAVAEETHLPFVTAENKFEALVCY